MFLGQPFCQRSFGRTVKVSKAELSFMPDLPDHFCFPELERKKSTLIAPKQVTTYVHIGRMTPRTGRGPSGPASVQINRRPMFKSRLMARPVRQITATQPHNVSGTLSDNVRAGTSRSRSDPGSIIGSTPWGNVSARLLTRELLTAILSLASRVGLTPSPTCLPGQGGSRKGMRPFGNETGRAKRLPSSGN